MATALKLVPPEAKVTSFVSRKHNMLINGKWVDSASGNKTQQPVFARRKTLHSAATQPRGIILKLDCNDEPTHHDPASA
jgi:hypothetical protein